MAMEAQGAHRTTADIVADATDLVAMLSWKDRAACLGIDPNVFFPVKYDSKIDGYVADNSKQAAASAKEYCSRCEVRLNCLEYVMRRSPDPDGIWGGMTERERRTARRRRRRQAQQ